MGHSDDAEAMAEESPSARVTFVLQEQHRRPDALLQADPSCLIHSAYRSTSWTTGRITTSIAVVVGVFKMLQWVAYIQGRLHQGFTHMHLNRCQINVKSWPNSWLTKSEQSFNGHRYAASSGAARVPKKMSPASTSG